LHEVADFPRTASGKVQKYLVRASLAAAPGQQGGAFGDQMP